MNVADWLHTLGLERYEAAFLENDISAVVLPNLTAEDLKDLGVTSVGHRRQLLDAIAILRSNGELARDRTIAGLTVDPADNIAHLSAPPAAERRQVTVMFCDMAGFTQISTRLDPEDLSVVIRTYQSCVATAIARFDGFIARYVGDGVLIYFGYPRAQEDGAERAVRAGLAVVAAIGGAPTLNELVRVRIGIATGLVVVGEPIGTGEARQQTAIGETPNLASRLQALAELDAVVIDAGTRRLVGDLFEYRDLGAVAVKGIAEPVPAWQVLGTSSVDNRFEALRTSSPTPLVGREDELELLLGRWRRAREGDGQTVLLSGEAGIGKSRILAAFEERLRGEPHIRLLFFCSPHHRDITLHPLVARIERAAGFARDDKPEAKLDKLDLLLQQSGQSSPEEGALFADLMGLPTADRYPTLPLDAQRRRELTLEAFVRQLEAHAQNQPVLLVFDDVHWMDSTSLELLDVIAGRVPHLRVLFCVTFRPEFEPPWTGLAGVTTLVLSRLGEREAAGLVLRVTGGKSLPPDLIDQIVRRADGIPLFVEELTKALLEGGFLQERNDDYVPVGPLPSAAVPSSLYASLMSRLDRLSPVKEVAQIGAAVGREFSYELIAALAQRTNEQLRDALQQLVSSGIIFRRGVPPNESYIFKHALVQDAAHDSLLRRRRQDLHARIGNVLEARFPEIVASQPEIMAHHYTEAGLADIAINYWRKAGERALRRSANVEGVAHLTHAIKLIESLPATRERDRRELDLHLTLGQMMRATEGYAGRETLRVFARARDLLDERAAVSERNTVLYGLWSVHYVRAEHVAARDVSLQCLQLAKQHRDPDSALANLLMGCSSWAKGAFVDSRRHLELTRKLCATDAADAIVSRFAQNNGVAALSYLSWTLWPLGYPEQAAAAAREAILRARRTGHVPLTAYALFVQAFLATAFGSEDDSPTTSSDDAVAYCIEHRVLAYEHWARFCQAIASRQNDDPRSAIEQMRDAMGAAQRINALFLRPLHLGHLAVAHMSIDQPEVALGLLDEAIQVAQETEEQFFAAELRRLRGEVLLKIGEQSEGEKALYHALTLAREQGARLWELHSAASLARLRRDQGRHAEARDLLAPVYGWFTEGFATPDLIRAKALLDELGHPSVSGTSTRARMAASEPRLRAGVAGNDLEGS